MARYEDRGENFYFDQEDVLVDLAFKRRWKWKAIRPNAIVGYTPAGNDMAVALTLAIYFICCKETGEAPTFPGNKIIYNSVDDASFAPSLADMKVWAATSEKTANEAFNHTNGDMFVWKYFWQAMGSYFDVNVAEVGEGEASGEDQPQMSHNFLMTEWAKDKKPVWERVVAKYGGHPKAFGWGTWGFLDWITGKAWPTIGSISKARKYGWMRYDDTYDCYVETFRSFENAGVLPQPREMVAL
ncbi:hypothetical protein NW764_016485 [Fusarium oxysporum]|nr:hypothetical protein NW764_016485 [Fusarium oxysporum]